jgi:hypothetical protein
MSPVSDPQSCRRPNDVTGFPKAKILTRNEHVFLAKLAEDAERFEGELCSTFKLVIRATMYT